MKKLATIITIIWLTLTPDIQMFRSDIDSNKIWNNIIVVNKSYDPYYDQAQSTFCIEALITRDDHTKQINRVICVSRKRSVIEFLGDMIKYIKYV